jgi:tRNA-splicing ligase RtcB (3'-phosphate/5'-hydroxy nucleic acid ligase)
MSNYKFIKTEGAPIKAWINGVPVEPEAEAQLRNMAALPFIYKHVAVMPDVHLGKGATVGSVIPTKGAIVPAAVGVDIGCGMCAAMTDLVANDLPDSLIDVRTAIEAAIPVGPRSHKEVTKPADKAWYGKLKEDFGTIDGKHPGLTTKASPAYQLGTLGGGNHFIEVCLDEADRVWVMLHSGSRNVGNRIGSYFITKAKEEMERLFIRLSDKDLAYLAEGSTLFDDYVEAVGWAQDYARVNRDLMLTAVIDAIAETLGRTIGHGDVAVNCHHNYVVKEEHFGDRVWVTRKGAVRAGVGELGIIPGSMGAKSYIVRGRGNPDSFHTCSHGAGRAMSRTEAKRRFTVEDHVRATEGVECRKDTGVIDETPAAYKDIDAVMAAQSDLVEVVHTLKQVLCVKG